MIAKLLTAWCLLALTVTIHAGGLSVEGLTGILMCGLSTGFFFAVVSRMLALGAKAEQT